MKNYLKAICPPIIWLIFKKFKPKKVFFGVYERFDQITDEKPWDKSAWIELQKNKLRDIRTSMGARERIIPSKSLNGYLSVICMLVNLLSVRRKCRVLDFCGGTGFVYYKIKPNLRNRQNIFWHVVDYNKKLLEMGSGFSLKDDRVEFSNQLPDQQENKFDIVYVNTSLQYFENYKIIFKNLLLFNPSYLVLTRLLAGNIKSYTTHQDLWGHELLAE
jgi:putative methyltransferase (TIGR04325 family)